MSRPTRRQVIHQPTPQYAAVPLQSPSRSNSQSVYQQQPQYTQPPQVSGPRPVRSASANSNRRNSNTQNGRNAMARGVATGDIGAGYGPYSVRLLYFNLLSCFRLIYFLNSITPNKPERLASMAQIHDLARLLHPKIH